MAPRAIILASLFWMVGGTFFIAARMENSARKAANDYFDGCIKRVPEGFDCWAARDRIFEAHTDKLEGGLWGFSAMTAALILLLALIALAIIYGSVRWVLAGRTK
jgi:hypothetical protein